MTPSELFVAFHDLGSLYSTKFNGTKLKGLLRRLTDDRITVTDAQHPKSNPITVFNDVTSYDRAATKKLFKRLNQPWDRSIVGFTVPEYLKKKTNFTPYRNYTVSDFGLSPLEYVYTQIHETGNSFRHILNKQIYGPGYWPGDLDAGNIIEHCVRNIYYPSS